MPARIAPREWRNALLWAFALMALTTLPYLACAAAGDEEWVFGGSVLGVTDGNSYLAKMRQGARGAWLFQIVYTSEPHDGALLFLPYLLLGKIAARLADPDSPALVNAMAAVFQAARLAFGALLILVTYRFAAAFLRGSAARLAATVLITTGGGLGWLLSLAGQGEALGSPPVDLTVPEGYTFLILYHLPHMALSRSLMLGGLLLISATLPQGGDEAQRAASLPTTGTAWFPRAALAGVCWAGMALCVPFYLAALYLILGAWGLGLWLRRRRFPWDLFRSAAVGAAATLPVLLYTAYHFTVNEVFKAWSSQNVLPSPHPLHYLLGYGVLAVPALWGIRWVWRRGRARDMLLASWVIAAPAMVYLPVNVQRRLAEGVFVPLGILAVMGLRGAVGPWLAGRLRWKRRRAWKLALGVALWLTLPTSLLVLVGGVLAAAKPNWPIFHLTAEIAAMDWLSRYAPPGAVVFAAFETGNYLPVRADVRAFLGHGPETVRAGEKQATVDAFFAGEMTVAARAALFTEHRIRYVFYGPQEGATPGAPAPVWAADLKMIYQKDGYTLYEVLQ